VPSQKLDARLLTELRLRVAQGDGEHLLPVLIERFPEARPSGRSANRSPVELAHHREAELSGIVARLKRLGARSVQTFVLSSAVSAQLTPSQVQELALDPEVRRIRLSRPERVTA
jgi:hypothetical protein